MKNVCASSSMRRCEFLCQKVSKLIKTCLYQNLYFASQFNTLCLPIIPASIRNQSHFFYMYILEIASSETHQIMSRARQFHNLRTRFAKMLYLYNCTRLEFSESKSYSALVIVRSLLCATQVFKKKNGSKDSERFYSWELKSLAVAF